MATCWVVHRARGLMHRTQGYAQHLKIVHRLPWVMHKCTKVMHKCTKVMHNGRNQHHTREDQRNSAEKKRIKKENPSPHAAVICPPVRPFLRRSSPLPVPRPLIIIFRFWSPAYASCPIFMIPFFVLCVLCLRLVFAYCVFRIVFPPCVSVLCFRLLFPYCVCVLCLCLLFSVLCLRIGFQRGVIILLVTFSVVLPPCLILRISCIVIPLPDSFVLIPLCL